MPEDDNSSGISKPKLLPDEQSGVRRAIADASGSSYVALKSLAGAQAVPDGTVVLEGDDGGQIYLVAKARYVQCSEEALAHLLHDLDAREWNDVTMARVYYERHRVGESIAGGMGGAVSPEVLWVHPRLVELESSVRAVLEGRLPRISDPVG